ncbi:MAG: N-acetyl-gamma-glutamyl-phosphate reductase, partial [Desulfovibrio sp.]|nr:N-acetyl-gamma-glutamyl-phosphate reductase [Desulfovibrio sp.]
VYGLPELYAKDIAKTSLVANPGCYPSSIILGLYAALKNKLIHTKNIIVDSKSGTTGAGRKPGVPTLFSEVQDSFRAYGLARHRHTPEIEQEIGRIANESVTIQFSPHLVPMNQGILSTIYTELRDPAISPERIYEAYCTTWENSPWIRVLPLGKLPETRFVRGTMFCDIGLVPDKRTKRLIIVSAIDNLCRGAAGQALANANLMCNLPVDSGLSHCAPLF